MNAREAGGNPGMSRIPLRSMRATIASLRS